MRCSKLAVTFRLTLRQRQQLRLRQAAVADGPQTAVAAAPQQVLQLKVATGERRRRALDPVWRLCVVQSRRRTPPYSYQQRPVTSPSGTAAYRHPTLVLSGVVQARGGRVCRVREPWLPILQHWPVQSRTSSQVDSHC